MKPLPPAFSRRSPPESPFPQKNSPAPESQGTRSLGLEQKERIIYAPGPSPVWETIKFGLCMARPVSRVSPFSRPVRFHVTPPGFDSPQGIFFLGPGH